MKSLEFAVQFVAFPFTMSNADRAKRIFSFDTICMLACIALICSFNSFTASTSAFRDPRALTLAAETTVHLRLHRVQDAAFRWSNSPIVVKIRCNSAGTSASAVSSETGRALVSLRIPRASPSMITPRRTDRIEHETSFARVSPRRRARTVHDFLQVRHRSRLRHGHRVFSRAHATRDAQ